ncbi:SRPBCC family protein [Rubrobacter naiadicus]|uniref:SRPBCC family protein n=1 Tax=Rubrobacter naiadicus TaxID=1392641 RepID=UPI002362565F|nr:SRPBCC family protein [Rubrobacter naiadicus]
MKIENEFAVKAPLGRVWETMLDLERIAPCLPGASIEESADGEYLGTMAVRLGSISVRYRGTVRLEEADEENRRARLRASGRETRGQGTASATITATMRGEGDTTRVRVETDLDVSGRVAQFGRGIMQDVASEIMSRFASCLEREILGEGAREPAAPASERGDSGSSPGEEGLDLAGVGGRAVLRRALPLLTGAGGLVLGAALAGVLARRRRSHLLRLEVGKPRRR